MERSRNSLKAETQKPIVRREKRNSAYDSKRVLIEQYMDEMKGNKRFPERQRAGATRTPSAEGQRESRTITPGYQRNPERSIISPSEQNLIRSYSEGPVRKRQLFSDPPTGSDDFSPPFKDTQTRSFQPIQNERFDQDTNYLKNTSPEYPSEGPTSRDNPFLDGQTEENRTRSALFNVKSWLQQQNESTMSTSKLVSDVDEENDVFNEYEKGFGLKLGLLGGLSQTSNSDTTVQARREEEQLSHNYYFGLLADMNAGRYLGAEVDAYYGIAPVNTIVEPQSNSTSSKETEKSLRHSGALCNLKAQLPIYSGDLRYTPKLGVGYGFMSLNQESFSLAVQQIDHFNESGMYWTAGIDILLSKSLTLNFDYSSSINATAEMGFASSSQTNNINSVSNGVPPIFNRLRIGAQVRVSRHVLLGAQFIQRTMKAIVAPGSAPMTTNPVTPSSKEVTESLTQILGMIMIQL